MLLYRKCHGDHQLWIHLVTKCSFSHNLTEASKQKNYLMNVVKEYVLMTEMSCRPLNIESFGHKMFICHNSSFNNNGSLVSSRARFFFKTTKDVREYVLIHEMS